MGQWAWGASDCGAFAQCSFRHCNKLMFKPDVVPASKKQPNNNMANLLHAGRMPAIVSL